MAEGFDTIRVRPQVRIAQGGLVEDRSACFEYVDAAGKRLDARLAKEADSGEAGE